MDLTYDVQLNTRAQIGSLQEQSQAQQSNIFTLQQSVVNLANNMSFVFSDDAKGYYILPGGLKIQWGKYECPADGGSGTRDVQVAFPIPFTQSVFSFLCSVSGGDNGWGVKCCGYPLSLQIARIVIQNMNSNIANTIYCVAIGI